VVKLPQTRDCTRQSNDVSRSTCVNPHCKVFGDCQVVNGRKMKNSRSLLLDQLEIGGTQGKPGLADVAFDDPETSLPAELREPLDFVHCTRPQRRLHQQNEITLFAC
jgi:hypothetical protein